MVVQKKATKNGAKPVVKKKAVPKKVAQSPKATLDVIDRTKREEWGVIKQLKDLDARVSRLEKA